MHFTEQAELCEDRNVELEALSDAVYRHIYERNVKFSYQPQVDDNEIAMTIVVDIVW